MPGPDRGSGIFYERLPWGRLGTIEDIGRAAAFLCSDAADYITGAVFRVDGGFWLPRFKATRR